MAYTIPPSFEVDGRQHSRTLFVALHVGAAVRTRTQTTLGLCGACCYQLLLVMDETEWNAFILQITSKLHSAGLEWIGGAWIQ